VVTARASRVDVTEPEDPDFGRHDYASAFEVAVTGVQRSPRQWARAVFEDSPSAVRRFVVFGWKYVLHFRLGPRPSADHVLGWKVRREEPDLVALEVRSGLLSALKVVRVHDSRGVMTTYVRYERPLGRALWSAVAPVHHRTEPYLLGHAVPRGR
jgi:hypothetical protein